MAILLTAHSGCEGTPPNSLDHVRAAIAGGADFVELDVRLAAGRLVLGHDADQPDALELETLWPLAAAAGLNLDVKEERVLAPLAAFLQRKGSQPGQVVVTGCDETWVSRWRSLLPTLPALLNVLVGPESDESASEWELRLVTQALQCGAPGLNADYRLVTPGLRALTRRAGLSLFVWTVNAASDWQALRDLGVDGLTTDRMVAAHEFLMRS